MDQSDLQPTTLFFFLFKFATVHETLYNIVTNFPKTVGHSIRHMEEVDVTLRLSKPGLYMQAKGPGNLRGFGTKAITRP